MNPTALIPVPQPGDLRQDRVGQLLKRVLDGVTSEETRRAYRHALEMFLGFCGREGNPTLPAELVASYRVSLVGEGKSSSTASSVDLLRCHRCNLQRNNLPHIASHKRGYECLHSICDVARPAVALIAVLVLVGA